MFLQRLRVLEHLRDDALVSHVIASSLLVPNVVLGAGELSLALDRFGAMLRERAERLFVRAPRELRADDIESEEMRTSLVQTASLLAKTQVDDAQAPAQLCVIGDPEKDRIAALLVELEVARKGSAIPWILVAELLGAAVRCRGVERIVLAEYRTALIRQLSRFAEQPSEIFLRALVTERQPALQAQLLGAVDALRAAALLGS